MAAAKIGNEKIIISLLKNDANVRDQNQYGKTALMFAVEEGHIKIIKQLVKNDNRHLAKLMKRERPHFPLQLNMGK